jgi:hypothetical protein
MTMQTKQIDIEAGFALLKLPFSNEPQRPNLKGSAELFKRASVLTDSNVCYAANSYETNAKR